MPIALIRNGGNARTARSYATALAVVAMLWARPSRLWPLWGRWSPAGADLPEELQARIDRSLDLLLISAKTKRVRSINEIAINCLAAADLVAAGDARFTPLLKDRAHQLVLLGSRYALEAPSWGRLPVQNVGNGCANGGTVSFNRTDCDPPETAYGFQSALAIACLARAGRLLGSPELALTAERAIHFWQLRMTRDSRCGSCAYFPWSDYAADADRRVRNINALLAMADAVADLSNQRDTKYIQDVLAAETFERSHENAGNLSVLDPGWSEQARGAIDDHDLTTSAALIGIWNVIHDPTAKDLALWNYDAWASFQSTSCRGQGCRRWSADFRACSNVAAYGHCAWRSVMSSRNFLESVTTWQIPSPWYLTRKLDQKGV